MTSPPIAGLSRRALLRGAAVAAAATAGAPVLAACGRSATQTAPTQAGPLGLTFPGTFVFGAATSAYQIEGAAAEDGRGPSIWDTFSHTPNNVRNGDTGDVAADHYHRWTEDLDLVKSLGLGSYRFSISWSRVLPTGTGTVNRKGLDFYKRLIEGMRERGIAPVATMFHWDLPQALQDRGGWENRDCASWFADYAQVLYRELGDLVPTWLTLNEPKTVVQVGYQFGAHAPGRRDTRASLVVAHHLLLAHGLAVRAYRAAGGTGRIGPALNLAPAYPVDDSEPAREAALLADGVENRLYLDPILKGAYPADVVATWAPDEPVRAAIRPGDLAVIASPVDILAVQYYNPVFVTANGDRAQVKPTSEASWQQIYPEGLFDVLTRIKRDYGDLPITITENGIPVDDAPDAAGKVNDGPRVAFLRDHLAAAHRALQSGVRLESYHVWSLLDNFEWAEGYAQRWGITYVDFATQKRIPKASAEWYRTVATSRRL
ncbi:GH1 family beta-glucosidase [Luedemannella helvata]|uniref:Beta-glucosidase n=1 Tax=Luedemannella helvata TaxID=349315 RepID=A0ABP4WS04_9ACTN